MMVQPTDLAGKENTPEVVFIDVIAEGLALHSLDIPKLSSKDKEVYLLEQATQKFGLPASSAVLYELKQACSSTTQAVRYAVHIPGSGELYIENILLHIPL
jgi:hypothetical protein